MTKQFSSNYPDIRLVESTLYPRWKVCFRSAPENRRRLFAVCLFDQEGNSLPTVEVPRVSTAMSRLRKAIRLNRDYAILPFVTLSVRAKTHKKLWDERTRSICT